jgi:hypothetical protein
MADDLSILYVEPGLHAGSGPEGVVVDLVAAADEGVQRRGLVDPQHVLPQLRVLPARHVRTGREAVA